MLDYKRKSQPNHWNTTSTVTPHNTFNAGSMSRFVGFPVSRRDFELEEDTQRAIAPGVTWRRRRFRFFHEASKVHNEKTAEGLCINELTIDSDAAAEPKPMLASDHPYLIAFEEIERAYRETYGAKSSLRQEGVKAEPSLFLNVSRLYHGQESSESRTQLHGTLLALSKSIQNGRNGLDEMAENFDGRFTGDPEAARKIVRWLPAFPASRLLQCSENILAVTNAGFFLNFPEEYDDQVSALHQTMGGLMLDGRLVAPPWVRRPGILRFEDGAVASGLIGPADLEIHVTGMAPVPLHIGVDENEPHGAVWRSWDSDMLNPPPGTAELIFCGGALVHAGPARPDTRPPLGGAVVWLTGRHAEAVLEQGELDNICLWMRAFEEGEISWMLCGGPFLVRQSEAITPEEMLEPAAVGEFYPTGPAPTRFPYNVSASRSPRTAFGTTPTGGWKIVVVDGRRSGEHSLGVTLEGLAHIMDEAGCECAVNLDGGGSSVLAVEGANHADALTENIPLGIVNIPSDPGPRERILPAFLTVQMKE